MKTILSVDDPNLIKIETDFNALVTIIEGDQSNSEIGLFSLVDVKYQTTGLLLGNIREMTSVFENSISILDVLETNALANGTVDETIMNLRQSFSFGIQEISHIHGENSTVIVSEELSHFLSVYNKTSYDYSVTNLFTQLGPQIDGALADTFLSSSMIFFCNSFV